MKKNGKVLLSSVLVFALLFSLSPLAFAEDATDKVELSATGSSTETEKYYDNITVTVTDDYGTAVTVSAAEGATVVLTTGKLEADSGTDVSSVTGAELSSSGEGSSADLETNNGLVVESGNATGLNVNADDGGRAR